MDVKNTGTLAGEEVVQMYVKHLQSKVERPIEELRGFERVRVVPNQTKTVQFHLKAAGLSYWDEASRGFVVENDKVKIRVGSSSADIILEKTLDSAPWNWAPKPGREHRAAGPDNLTGAPKLELY